MVITRKERDGWVFVSSLRTPERHRPGEEFTGSKSNPVKEKSASRKGNRDANSALRAARKAVFMASGYSGREKMGDRADGVGRVKTRTLKPIGMRHPIIAPVGHPPKTTCNRHVGHPNSSSELRSGPPSRSGCRMILCAENGGRSTRHVGHPNSSSGLTSGPPAVRENRTVQKLYLGVGW